MPLADIMAGIILVSLILYAVLGGADFGGGVWELFATGPRREEQRETISEAIGPIWEANHVWVILVVTLLFAAFPPAFAAILTALHVPITLMLIGIVLRGSAFVFRHYDVQEMQAHRRWGRIFAVSSLITPVLLGIVIGTISTHAIRIEDGTVVGGFFRPWIQPFTFAVGFFALAQFAFLAATYLTVEADDPEIREDFRTRALIAAVIVGVLAATVLLLSGGTAPELRAGLTQSWWSWPLHVATGLAAVGAIAALWFRRYLVARVLAATQVALILLGWGLAMYPYLIAGAITVQEAASPPITLTLLLIALAAGSLILFPAFFYLFRTFKGGVILAPMHGESREEEGKSHPGGT